MCENLCSICQKSSGGRGAEGAEGYRVWPGRGRNPFPRKFFIFSFKIVHSSAFSYTNSKVLFAINCRERYVIMVFLAIDSDVFINLVNHIQSVISNWRRFHSYSRHVLWA